MHLPMPFARTSNDGLKSLLVHSVAYPFSHSILCSAVYMDPSPYLSLPHKVLEFVKGTGAEPCERTRAP